MVSYFKGRLYKIAMTMKSVELEFLGVHMMEPEDFLCALLAHPDSHKIVPVWMSLSDGARLSSRADGYNPSRPDTHDLLLELLEAQGGVTSIVVNNVHEGAFYVEVTTGAEKNLDARVSDALVLSMHFNVPLTIDEELLGKVGLYVTRMTWTSTSTLIMKRPRLFLVKARVLMMRTPSPLLPPATRRPMQTLAS